MNVQNNNFTKQRLISKKRDIVSPIFFSNKISLKILLFVRIIFLTSLIFLSILQYLYSQDNFVKVISSIQIFICITIIAIIFLSWQKYRIHLKESTFFKQPNFDEDNTGFENTIFKTSPFGLATINISGKICQYNDTFAQMLGLNTDSANEYNFYNFFSTDSQITLPQILALKQVSNNNDPFELTLRDPSRRIFSLYLGDYITSFNNGLDERIIHLIEITAFKELENQIVQSRKMQAIGQLAGGIAHDFNNLLTAMLGFCDLLLVRHRVGDDSFSDILQIKQNANRAASLVRQLLAFSRQQTLRPRVISISTTLEELSHLLRRLIGQSIELQLINISNLGLVRVDLSQFEQVIINLVVNARDAMPNGGKLTIRTKNTRIKENISLAHETMPQGNYVQIDVIDTGVGISEDVQGRIFDPFFTTKPVGQGTGLGLSTVWGIVRQTGGFVTLKSEINRGTVFTIYLPRYNGTEVAEERRSENIENIFIDKNLHSNTNIILVEDESAVRMITARALSNQGFKVHEADSGENAIKYIESNPEIKFDMLITDAVMPVIDGPSLIRIIRNKYPIIKVICISGHIDESLREKLNQLGDVRFIAKPFALQQLLNEVREKLNDSQNFLA